MRERLLILILSGSKLTDGTESMIVGMPVKRNKKHQGIEKDVSHFTFLSLNILIYEKNGIILDHLADLALKKQKS